MVSKMNTRKSLILCFMSGLLLLPLSANQANAAEHDLTFAVSGVVESIKVKIGDQVKVGTVLAILDLTTFNAVKRSTEATRTSAKVMLGFAEVKMKQAQELFDALSTSGEEVERAEVEYAKAFSDYQNARSQDEIANWRLQRATLKAPFSGIVSAVPGYPGIVVDISASNQTVVVIRK